MLSVDSEGWHSDIRTSGATSDGLVWVWCYWRWETRDMVNLVAVPSCVSMAPALLHSGPLHLYRAVMVVVVEEEARKNQ